MDIEENLFGWLDYVVFIGMLAMSACIGVFYACRGKQSTDDILVGGKSMGVVPVSYTDYVNFIRENLTQKANYVISKVAASIMATFMSATGLLGVPAEQFLYGTQLILSYMLIVMPIMTFMSCYLIVPVFYNLGSCSANEYLERRFGKPIRAISCVLYILTMVSFTHFYTLKKLISFLTLDILHGNRFIRPCNGLNPRLIPSEIDSVGI